MSKKIDRTGETNINNQGCKMKIIEYKDANNLVIEFQDEHKYQEKNKYERFKKGNILNPYHPTVYNVGYMGETKCCDDTGKHKLSNIIWKDMIKRCYDEEWKNKHPYYQDCKVCDEWLNYSNFEKWFNENYYEIDEQINLDKDLLNKGNNLYSPEKCCLIPHRVNAILVKTIRKTEQSKSRSLPIGVYKSNNLYRVRLFDYQNRILKRISISSCNENDIDNLFNKYKESKEKYIRQIAEEYKDLIPIKAYNALCNYKIEKE